MTERIRARLSEGALLLEPRDVYDAALVDATNRPDDHWPRKTRMTVAVYDREKCIEALMTAEGWDYEAATEWFDFNTSGAWDGEGTPTFRSVFDQAEDDDI